MRKEGGKVLIAHRRLFEKDLARFFVGAVAAFDGTLVKVVGYSYSPELMSGQIIKKSERRTKLLPLASGTILFYLLPEDVVIDEVWFVTEAGSYQIYSCGLSVWAATGLSFADISGSSH